jgi:transposase, IS5 family
MPADWNPAKRRQKVVDARWSKKHGRSYFGYKVSANADKRYKRVRKIKVSTASEHDIAHFEDVLDPANTNRNILADKGYVDGERGARPGKQGWRLYIQRKGGKDKPISNTQRRRNRRIAKTRARIEHVFAGLAQMGGKALRSIGLARAALHLNWKVAAYNLQRLVYLKEARVEAFRRLRSARAAKIGQLNLRNRCRNGAACSFSAIFNRSAAHGAEIMGYSRCPKVSK